MVRSRSPTPPSSSATPASASTRGSDPVLGSAVAGGVAEVVPPAAAVPDVPDDEPESAPEPLEELDDPEDPEDPDDPEEPEPDDDPPSSWPGGSSLRPPSAC